MHPKSTRDIPNVTCEHPAAYMAKQQVITVYIIFPVHNRIDETKLFLQSLAKQTAKNYKLVICDDGSTDGTSEYLATNHPDVIVLKGNGHLWWTAGINKCVKYVLENCHDSDYILTLNNDAQLSENYLKHKIDCATDFPNAIIGSLCLYSDNTSLIETSGYIMDFDTCTSKQLDKPGDMRTALHRGMMEVTHLPGKGVMFPVKVFRAIGLYDEVNFPQYHADTDLVLRAFKAGHKVFVDYDAILLSSVNTGNMVLPTYKITIKGIVQTFIGPYSMNNIRIRNNFAKKHCSRKRIRYLTKTYLRIITGLITRYIRYKFL